MFNGFVNITEMCSTARIFFIFQIKKNLKTHSSFKIFEIVISTSGFVTQLIVPKPTVTILTDKERSN
jgi:hypothetical protein